MAKKKKDPKLISKETKKKLIDGINEAIQEAYEKGQRDCNLAWREVLDPEEDTDNETGSVDWIKCFDGGYICPGSRIKLLTGDIGTVKEIRRESGNVYMIPDKDKDMIFCRHASEVVRYV